MEQSRELERYIISLINAINDDTSTYSKNVNVKLLKDKILVAFNSPTSFILDSKLYFKIFDVLNVPLFPVITLIPQDNMIVEEYNSENFMNKRCFSYPFRVGVPKRKKFETEEDFKKDISLGKWEIMQGVDINIKDLTSIAIASNSGGGKSYLIYQFLLYFKEIGADLIIVDGKKDLPSKFAKENNLKLVTNDSKKSEDNVLTDVCEILNEFNTEIYERQHRLFTGEVKERDLKPIVLVFDEIGALTNLASKNIKENFFKLLTRIATLGRQSNIHLLLSSQRLDSNTIPTIIKEQCNVLIQLGSLNSNHLQYLFPDIKDRSILLPKDDIEKGRGIISSNNDVYTFLVPTIKKEVANG